MRRWSLISIHSTPDDSMCEFGMLFFASPIIVSEPSTYLLLYSDCWNRPITGVASRSVKLLDRTSDDYNKTFKLTGTVTEAINFASYNYCK